MSAQTDRPPAQCACGKVRYYTRKQARQAATRMWHRQTGGRPRAYQCASGFWHLGRISTDLANGSITGDEYRKGVMIATYNGQCAICNTAIEKGNKIYPDRGSPRHTECAPLS